MKTCEYSSWLLPIVEVKFGVDSSGTPLKECFAGALAQFRHTFSGGVNTPRYDEMPAHYRVPIHSDVTISLPPNTTKVNVQLRNHPFDGEGMQFSASMKMRGQNRHANAEPKTTGSSSFDLSYNAPPGKFFTELLLRTKSKPILLTNCTSQQA